MFELIQLPNANAGQRGRNVWGQLCLATPH